MSVFTAAKKNCLLAGRKVGADPNSRERQEGNSETEKDNVRDRGGYGGFREQVQTVMQSNGDKAVEKYLLL